MFRFFGDLFRVLSLLMLNAAARELLRRQRQERIDKFGQCGFCDEILDHPIHDTDCPARLTERELML